MSNPAVITLDNAGNRRGKFKRFIIEDNIGEAIHLHVDNMRIDFTIKEFLDFSSLIRASLNELDFLCGYKIENFDEYFLRSCADFLSKLKDIKIESARLADLKCVIPLGYKGGMKLYKVVLPKELPAYRYLKGDKSCLPKLDLYDYFTTPYKDRLTSLLTSFKKEEYPIESKYIILFNGQNYVRYGEDYVSVLGYLYGFNKRVSIMRFNFQGKNHLLSPFKHNIVTISKRLFKIKK
jgi:hypothetical protein